MRSVSVVLRMIVPRIVIAAVFSVLWCDRIAKNQSPSAPLVFSAALYVAAAWFTYLRKDGVRIPLWSRERKPEHDDKPLREKWVTDDIDVAETENRHAFSEKIIANLVAASILIGVSFF